MKAIILGLLLVTTVFAQEIKRDAYENDNARKGAGNIIVGEVQEHTIFPARDKDWFLFIAPDAGEYTITTSNQTLDLAIDVVVQQGLITLPAGSGQLKVPGQTLATYMNPSAAGIKYYIGIWGCNPNETGNYEIAIEKFNAQNVKAYKADKIVKREAKVEVKKEAKAEVKTEARTYNANLACNAGNLWKELPERANDNGTLNHIPPLFHETNIDWQLPTPTNWTRAEIATKKSFNAENLDFDFEFNWNGNGTIEFFICDANDVTESNWKPDDFYQVYISSHDTPFLEINGYRNNQRVFHKTGIEPSSNFMHKWVNVTIKKRNTTWYFYRDGQMINSNNFTE